MAGFFGRLFGSSEARDKNEIGKKLDMVKTKLRQQEDARGILKKDITITQQAILAKKTEYEAATGKLKKIVGDEIKLLHNKLQHFNGRNNIISNNIHQLDAVQVKLNELLQASTGSVDVELIDEINDDLGVFHEGIKEKSRATDELLATSMDSPFAEPVADVGELLDQMETRPDSSKKNEVDEDIRKIFEELSEN